jgi:L-lactate dehydrogenase (cytochrome)
VARSTPELGTTVPGPRLSGALRHRAGGDVRAGLAEAERLLARHAAAAGIPYGLSTVATRTPEDLKGAQGDQGWFQMYPPRDPGIRADMLPARGRRGFTR